MLQQLFSPLSQYVLSTSRYIYITQPLSASRLARGTRQRHWAHLWGLALILHTPLSKRVQPIFPAFAKLTPLVFHAAAYVFKDAIAAMKDTVVILNFRDLRFARMRRI